MCYNKDNFILIKVLLTCLFKRIFCLDQTKYFVIVNVGADKMIQLIGIKSQCDIGIRQKFSITSEVLEGKLKYINELVGSVLILSTCNRTEIYVDSNLEEKKLIDTVFYGLDWDYDLVSYIFYIKDKYAIKHLMEVSCGFHSKILGEDQILGQIKTAYDAALEAKTIKGKLQRLFQKAITCGKEFKHICESYRIPVSIPSIVAKEILNMDIRKYMIIGFGKIGQLLFKYLNNSQAQIIYIAVRDLNKVHDSYKKCGKIRFISFKDRKSYYNDIDCIVSCTSAPDKIISKGDLPCRKLTIFDLAVPEDIDRNVLDLDNVTLYDIDNISVIDEKNKAIRKKTMGKYRYILENHIDKFIKWEKLHQLSPEIQKVKKYGDEICEKRITTFKNKKHTKDNDILVKTMIESTARFYINRAIEVMKEEKLNGREEECLRLINKIFCK